MDALALVPKWTCIVCNTWPKAPASLEEQHLKGLIVTVDGDFRYISNCVEKIISISSLLLFTCLQLFKVRSLAMLF